MISAMTMYVGKIQAANGAGGTNSHSHQRERRGFGWTQSGCGGLVGVSFPPHPSVQTAQ